MNTRLVTQINGMVTVLLSLLLITSTTNAITFQLKTGTKNITLPDGKKAFMWGFGLQGSPITIPGPLLQIPPGDNSLTIELKNNLTEPVSIVIPGQTTTMTPVKFTDGQGRQRVRSFTHETASGQSAVYTWNNLKPGTYVYHSGTHPAVQVQMGLYGGITKDVAANQAYLGISYDNEVILFYSEVDRTLHQKVKKGKYGPGQNVTSTINYRPNYFLINGEAYSQGQAPIEAGVVGQTTLLRFFNMGLRTHVPTLNGLYMQVIAEDGNLYPYPREQYSVMLAAGKTKDALLTLDHEGSYAVYDRKLDLTNDKASAGGMLTYLNITTPSAATIENTVTIIQTKYGSKRNQLMVTATTEMAPDTVILTAAAHFGDTVVTLGNLRYIAKKGIYRQFFNDVTTKPDQITVTIWPKTGEMLTTDNSNQDTQSVPVPFKLEQ